MRAKAQEFRLRRTTDADLLRLVDARAKREGTSPLDVIRRACKLGLEAMARMEAQAGGPHD